MKLRTRTIHFRCENTVGGAQKHVNFDTSGLGVKRVFFTILTKPYAEIRESALYYSSSFRYL